MLRLSINRVKYILKIQNQIPNPNIGSEETDMKIHHLCQMFKDTEKRGRNVELVRNIINYNLYLKSIKHIKTCVCATNANNFCQRGERM